MSMDMFLPINQPQKFFHDPVVARYVTVYIIESMTTDANCLRFELHGCKQIGKVLKFQIRYQTILFAPIDSLTMEK